MKLVRARFENFRLLRDLDLRFSTDPEQKLTVIRAENDSGKTTILTALQWAFYGDDALPGDAKSYRLHPLDWTARTCLVLVEVDFDVTVTKRIGGTETKRYRVVRSVAETVGELHSTRGESKIDVYELSAAGGSRREDHAENRLRSELPPELREIFFTDGDQALSFIEADSATVKRRRVENAIKALLGLSVIEDAGKHVKAAGADINRQFRETNASERLVRASRRIEELDAELASFEAKMLVAADQQSRAEEFVEKLTKQIEAALATGNRNDLVQELTGIATQRRRDLAEELSTARHVGELLKDKLLARQLLSGHIAKAGEMLNTLKDQGIIPGETIPVLTERLKQGVCICGERLDDDEGDGQRRRQHIQHLIESSREADAARAMVSDLYYRAQELQAPIPAEGWKTRYADYFRRRRDIASRLTDLNAREALVEAKIANVSAVDINMLQAERKTAKRNADEQRDIVASLKVRMDRASTERRDVADERDRYAKEEMKGDRLRGELLVSQDILSIFDRTLARLKSEELQRVSALMNEIFLEMIGVDPEQGAIIQRAAISSEFDILVFGTGGRSLNPDSDLNGASRRALTLAFILALTRVSEVEAPNIIDTPLGMMSGYVKSSVLRSAIKYSSQLVLFLTRSEIAGTEAILHQYAGEVVTLTNPSHYPRMLIHQPAAQAMQSVKCTCSYDEHCDVCERRMEVDLGPQMELA